MIAITVNDLELNTGLPDANGATWYVTEWDGWDAAPLRQASMDPSLTDGGLITQNLYGMRSVTLSGVCKTASEAEMWTAYNRLAALINPADTVDLVVQEDVPKRLDVRLGESPRMSLGTGSSFAFNIMLLAPDPRKYAVDPTVVNIASGSTANLVNAGTASTFPVFRVSGMVELVNNTTGLHFITTESVAPLAYVDMRARTVMSGSLSQAYKMSPFSAWWALGPGTNSITNDGASSVQATYYDAWI